MNLIERINDVRIRFPNGMFWNHPENSDMVIFPLFAKMVQYLPDGETAREIQ